jgi:dihydrolipoamide dehydrogenase
MVQAKTQADLVVLGSGPAGYSAAFRAADLGLNVTLIERYDALGGVCLNVGCIPSKALLHAAKIINETKEMKANGLDFGEPNIDTDKLRQWKNKIVGKLTGGLQSMAKKRKVTVVTGEAEFSSSHELKVTTKDGDKPIEFDKAIIAAGSKAIKLPFLPDDERIFTSTGALELPRIDGRMLLIGGGIIGLEMANVYDALGCEVSVAEMTDQLMPAADKDVVEPFYQHVAKKYERIMLETRVTNVEAQTDGLYVTFEGQNAPDKPQKFDQILQGVGRKPNTDHINIEACGVELDDQGFIKVDDQRRTNQQHIYAVGDIVGQPMLAHKGVHEGRMAAEVVAGKKHYFDPKCIPSVAYTDPEVAWTGLTERELKQHNYDYEAAVFPWAANGRALAHERTEGKTKLLFNKKDDRILGAGITGPNAGELISELSLAIEMGCDAEDLSLTIHPHPTLSESVMMASEIYEGTITDLYMPKK